MALLLVEMGTAPPIVPGYDMLRSMNRFSNRHVSSDNCSCPIEEHSRTMALNGSSCACKRTDCGGHHEAVFSPGFPRCRDGKRLIQVGLRSCWGETLGLE